MQAAAPEPGAVGGPKKKRKNKKKKKNEDEVAGQNLAGQMDDMEEGQTEGGRMMMIVRDGGEMYEEDQDGLDNEVEDTEADEFVRQFSQRLA